MPRAIVTPVSTSSRSIPGTISSTIPSATPRATARQSGQRRSRAARVQPPVPLGSLTQPGARGGASCASCGSDCVTSLRMTLTDGTPVAFTSCHRCEHRTWNELGGGTLPVAKVLKKARKPR